MQVFLKPAHEKLPNPRLKVDYLDQTRDLQCCKRQTNPLEHETNLLTLL